MVDAAEASPKLAVVTSELEFTAQALVDKIKPPKQVTDLLLALNLLCQWTWIFQAKVKGRPSSLGVAVESRVGFWRELFGEFGFVCLLR